MKAHQCSGCRRDLVGGWLCTFCLNTLADRLVDVSWLVQELDVMLCRLAKMGPSGPRARGAETPLVFNWVAAETAWTLQRNLATWARRLARANGVQVVVVHGYHLTDPKDPSRVFPRRGVTEGIAGWLLEHLQWVGVYQDAGSLYADIIDTINQAVRAIDRPGQRAFVGRCGHLYPVDADGVVSIVACDAELYARAGDRLVTCPTCGEQVDVEQRRSEQLNAAQDFPVTATEASRALPFLLGSEVTSSAIRGYAGRGRLAPVPARDGASSSGPFYRLGDVVEAHAAAQDAKYRRKTPNTAQPYDVPEGHGLEPRYG